MLPVDGDPATTPGSEPWLAAAYEEAGRLLDAQRAALAQSLQAFTVGGTLLAAAAAYLTKVHAEALLGLPPLLGLLAIYLLQVYGDVKAMGCGRRHLEEAVNTELERPCLIYNTVVAPTRTRQTDPSHRVAYAAWLLAYLAIGFACIQGPMIYSGNAEWYTRGAWALTLLCAVGIGAALKAKDDVAEKVTKQWEEQSRRWMSAAGVNKTRA